MNLNLVLNAQAASVQEWLHSAPMAQLIADLAKSGNLKLVAFGALFFGVLILFLLMRWAFKGPSQVSMDSPDFLHRISVLETLISDYKARHAEQTTKMQGEIMHLRHELDALKETLALGCVESEQSSYAAE